MIKQLPNSVPKFFWLFLKPYKWVVFSYVFLALAAGLWGPLNSIIVKNLLNSLAEVKSDDFSILYLPAFLIIINFIVFDNITWRSIEYIRSKYNPQIINDIVGQTSTYVLRKSHQFYQDNLSGKIAKQITRLADGVEMMFNNIMCNLIRGLSLIVAAMVTAYFVNPIFFGILFLWFLFFVTVSIFMSKKLIVYTDKQALVESVVVGEIVDTLSNSSNVRVFSRREYESKRMLPFFKKQQYAYTATNIYSMKMAIVQGGLIALMWAFSIYFLIYLYSKNLVTIGDFGLILLLSIEAGHMMWFTMSIVDQFFQSVGRCRQSLDSICTPLEIQDAKNAKKLICKKSNIKFDNVKFHYKGTEPLFQNKTIEIKAGEKVGLVGYSGGGKTTFANLILRFYDLTDGAILIDGQDISKVTQESLRESIAMIPQDPSLFQRSLMENIRYGNTSASDVQVIKAAKKAHAHEFISKLPEGYDSLVGERGVKLSGGQRQRVAIARAILKDAPILILDEATSQLDSVTEQMIQESLKGLMKDRTTIVIAHRLSTLLNMDRILVFDKGKIVEDGTHKKLIANNGMYKKLWDAQVGGFLGDG